MTALRDSGKLPAEQCIDVRFADLMKHPGETLAKHLRPVRDRLHGRGREDDARLPRGQAQERATAPTNTSSPIRASTSTKNANAFAPTTSDTRSSTRPEQRRATRWSPSETRLTHLRRDANESKKRTGVGMSEREAGVGAAADSAERPSRTRSKRRATRPRRIPSDCWAARPGVSSAGRLEEAGQELLDFPVGSTPVPGRAAGRGHEIRARAGHRGRPAGPAALGPGPTAPRPLAGLGIEMGCRERRQPIPLVSRPRRRDLPHRRRSPECLRGAARNQRRLHAARRRSGLRHRAAQRARVRGRRPLRDPALRREARGLCGQLDGDAARDPVLHGATIFRGLGDRKARQLRDLPRSAAKASPPRPTDAGTHGGAARRGGLSGRSRAPASGRNGSTSCDATT